MRFEFKFGHTPKTPRPEPDAPFRILVLGDFDGRTSRGLTQPVSSRRPVRLDIETFDPFLERLRAEVQVGLPGAPGPLLISLAEMDDLHPDRLVDRLETFTALRRTRQRLLDKSTFASAAAEVRGWTESPRAAPAGATSAAEPTSGGSDAETLERLLGRAPAPNATAATRAPASAPTDAVSELLRPIVSPHVVAPPPSDQPTLVAAVDLAIADKMRLLLHTPAFQAIESAWRGLDFLVRHVEASESLQVFALNLSKAELAADLSSSDDLAQTALYRLLVESTVGSPGADPWGLVLGMYAFELDPADVESLARIAALAKAAGSPFVAGAGRGLLESVLRDPKRLAAEPGWTALRGRPEASYIGLACPGFLLRLPYGRTTDPTSAFAFEELAGAAGSEGYVWAAPGLALGVHLAGMFAESGWDMSPGASFELGGLPVHVRKEGGEATMMPCAEMWLSDSQAEALTDHGLIPLQSIRGKDAVRIPRVPSVRAPAAALAGRWA